MATAFAAKLGLPEGVEAPTTLIDQILKLLAEGAVDFTIFWRRLSHWAREQSAADQSVRDLFLDRAGFDAWIEAFSALHRAEDRAAASARMLASNPKYILRNHLGELAIRAAKQKDFGQVAAMLQVLQAPFDEHPEHEAFAGFAPDWAQSIEISCSS